MKLERKHVEPTEFERSDTHAIDRADSGENTLGTFPAVLATNGEASDGHILHIKGNKTPSRMSLLFGHRSDAMTPSLGSVTKPRKGKTADGKHDALRTTQVIQMEGDGQMADIRRNIALLVHEDDLNGMSVRWVPDEVIRRIDLPRNHYAFIDADKADRDQESYWGYFHKASHNQEGSIVAIGADPGALIGRAQELKGSPSSVFFRALAHSIEHGERADGMAQLGTAFGAYQEALAGIRTAGVCPEDLAMLVASDGNPTEMVTFRFADSEGKPQSALILRTAYEALQGESSRAYSAAIALYQEASEAKAEAPAPQRNGESLTPEEDDAKFNRVYPQKIEPKAKAPAAPKQIKQIKQRMSDMHPDEFIAALGSVVGKAAADAVAQVTGKVSD